MKRLLLLIVIITITTINGCGNKAEDKNGKSGNNKGKVNYQKEEIKILTSDSLNISANYYYNQKNKDEKQPVVVLIHQFKSSKEQWSGVLIDSLINNGMKVLTFDLRSHGKSDKAKVEIDKLLTDQLQTPKDLEAVIRWVKNNPAIDSNRIGVAGTSIGGSLAFYSLYYLNVKAIVAISVGKLTFENLTGIFESMMGKLIPRVKGVLMICGTKDGDYYKESKMIFENYVDTPKEFKEFESDKHGKDLIADYPGINDLIIKWFKENL
ncbi:MAG: alpha/beta fold hydrolase [Ignavibacteria bacterium]|nr:alpha/beta fold hydrolase [Ignavibacteria bacterium]